MSYCRFSDDDFFCDFYAYESADGFMLHVAASRIDWDPPESPYTLKSLDLSSQEFKQVSDRYHQALQEAPRQPISLPGAGGSHRFDTLQELRESIREHLELGFQAPGWLLSSLDEELAEAANTEQPAQ